MAHIELDGIELASTHQSLNARDLEKINQLDCPVITHNFFPPNDDKFVINLASLDDEIRAKSLDYVLNAIRFATEIGAEIYTFHPGFRQEVVEPNQDGRNFDFSFGSKRSSWKAAFDTMLGSLDKVATEASKQGVNVLMETGGSVTSPEASLMETPEEFSQLKQFFGQSIGINFNLAHSFLAGLHHKFDVRELIDDLLPLISVVELSHNDQKIDQHLPLPPDSYIYAFLPKLVDKILVLEFRNCEVQDIVMSRKNVLDRLA